MLLLLAKILIPFLIIFNLLPLLIWLERKGSAYIQDRRGPNRAALFGMIRLGGFIHSLADVLKLLFKEDILPARVNRFFFILAPFTAMTVACVTYAVIPFAAPIEWNGQTITLQAANLDAGILYILALSSLGVFGIMLAGWSANNKYSLLGGLRSSAQMISYEIVMSLAVLSVVLIAGTLDLNGIVQNQGVWAWNFLKQPIACLLFLVAMFAETNRLPFDLPEGESELVAGYHVEYSSMKFAMFFMSEYAHMIVASAVWVSLFFGGWQVPFLSTEFLRVHASQITQIALLGGAFLHLIGALLLFARGRKNIRAKKWGDLRDAEPMALGIASFIIALGLGSIVYFFWPFAWHEKGQMVVAALVQCLTFLLKILLVCWLFVWVRWTLPRFRYDQLMRLGWKILLPLGLANLFLTALLVLVFSKY